MVSTVIKRDGRRVAFDAGKIKAAAAKAFAEADKALAEKPEGSEGIIERIAGEIAGGGASEMTVEEIQDAVEEKLMDSDRKDVAKAYILYRDERTRMRNRKSGFMKVFEEKLAATNVQNQNANVDERSFGGRRGEIDAEMMRRYALDNCMSEKARNSHMNNEIYIHDLDSYALGNHNCLSMPFDDLLAKGFNTRQTDVRPAQSASTAFQLVAVLFQLQSLQQFGGVSATHLDWTMVPYVRKSFWKHFRDGIRYLAPEGAAAGWLSRFDAECPKDGYGGMPVDILGAVPEGAAVRRMLDYAGEQTEREVFQAAEGLYHNLNTLQSRSGNQLPFTSVNYGTCALPEGRMVTKALLDASIEGTGRLHRTPIFPCGIFQYKKGVNDRPGTPNYDLFRLALKSTSLRLYPNYANVDWSGNAGYDPDDPRTYFSTMGCRTANGWDANGFGQLKDGRGNICPVTIILPTLAMEAEESAGEAGGDAVARFMEILDGKIRDARDMLVERFEYICSQPPESARFMYENGTMAGYVPEEGIRSALKHGTLAIGQLGLAEALRILVGSDQTEEEGMKLAIEIESLFKDRCAEFKKEYGLNFGVYYSPAENLCHTAMKKFKERYGEIPGVSDKEFFTNSVHVPVWKEMDPFEKIDVEARLAGFSSAGCITYVELPSTAKHNIDALETIVRYAMDKDIPYFAINVPNDMCMECGYTDEIGAECPQCGSTDIRRLRRVTGYLTGDYKSAFNLGKRQEAEMRVKHAR